MLQVTPTLAIDERELQESFVRASGPGGQNVNKLSTAVQLRFDVRRSPSLPEPVRARLLRLAGSRLTNEGEIVLTAQRFRTQDRNRTDARQRLAALIARAAEPPPPPRKPTRPTRGAREQRLAGKALRARVKAGRGRARDDD